MLKSYLKDKNLSGAQFAAQIGISPGFLSDLLSGKRAPGLRTAVRIEVLTDGAVPVRSWVPGECLGGSEGIPAGGQTKAGIPAGEIKRSEGMPAGGQKQ